MLPGSAHEYISALCLSGSEMYFRRILPSCSVTRGVEPGRVIRNSENKLKAIAYDYQIGPNGEMEIAVNFIDTSVTPNTFYGTINFGLNKLKYTKAEFHADALAVIMLFSVNQEWTMTESDVEFAWSFKDQVQADWNQATTTAPDYIKNKPATPAAKSISSPTRSIVTGTGATGFQVSATRPAWVWYDLSVVTTASIAGNAAGDIFLEVAPTNSATAGDWVKKGTFGNAQALSLAITLQSVQTTKGQLGTYVPAGYYVKLRSSGSGTVSYNFLESTEILDN